MTHLPNPFILSTNQTNYKHHHDILDSAIRISIPANSMQALTVYNSLNLKQGESVQRTHPPDILLMLLAFNILWWAIKRDYYKWHNNTYPIVCTAIDTCFRNTHLALSPYRQLALINKRITSANRCRFARRFNTYSHDRRGNDATHNNRNANTF